MNPGKRNGRTSVRDPDPNAQVETWLRDGLEPEPQQVRRVVRHALRGEAATVSTHALGWRLPLAAGAMAALVLGFVLLGRHGKAPGEAGPQASHRPAPLITNVSGTVELVMPQDSLPPVHEPVGEASGVVEVFNRDGCMAVVLPEGKVRYWIIGGDT
jgi:hypothetical protein